MNKFLGTGNICKDISLKKTNSGKSVLQNSIAIRNDFKNKEGNYDSEFVNIVVWNNQAEFLQKYASKGSKIGIVGKLTTRSYDAEDGTKKYISEVICESVELLETKKENTQPTEETLEVEKEKKENNTFSEFAIENEESINELDDDDLPF